MPTYDYRCGACGHQFEHFQSISDPRLKKCPECKKPKLERLIGAGGGLLFKGSGFYITDYRSSSYQDAAKKDAAPADAKPAAPASGDAKPATDGGAKPTPAAKAPVAKPSARAKPSGGKSGGKPGRSH